MKIALIIPTYNAGIFWHKWIDTYQTQSIKAEQIIVVDSSSTDETAQLAEQAGFFVKKIAKEDFDHGGTRNLAVKLSELDADILVFMTQDAILANETALQNLMEPFADQMVAAVYGQQLPSQDANPLATHARLFNYPSQNITKTRNDIKSWGIKCAFMSNSFAAYRKSIFDELGTFPENTILAEDMYLAAKMILAGYKIAYCSEAKVYHSHNYSLIQEFKRYFDTGVFQQKESWIQEEFGSVSGEGKRFVISELQYLWKNNPLWIPKALCSTLFKYIGFKFGLNWYKLPKRIIKILSMHKGYWK